MIEYSHVTCDWLVSDSSLVFSTVILQATVLCVLDYVFT